MRTSGVTSTIISNDNGLHYSLPITHYSLHTMHGLKNVFVLGENADTELFADARHVLLDHAERTDGIFDIHEHDEREKVLHDLLANVQYVAIAIGQFLRDARDDAGLILAERRDDDAAFRPVEVLERAVMLCDVFGFTGIETANGFHDNFFHGVVAGARTQLFFRLFHDLAYLIFGDRHAFLLWKFS